jgi:BMFP domain-containing protein YqiC
MTIQKDYEALSKILMELRTRFAALEARVRELESGTDAPRPGHNLQAAHSSASAELSRNAAQRLHESKAGWR